MIKPNLFFWMVFSVLAFAVIAPARAAERQVLQGHEVRAVKELHLEPVGRLASTKNLNLTISLPLRNQDALTNLLEQQYDPTSPEYHHWLTAKEFAEKFGPTERTTRQPSPSRRPTVWSLPQCIPIAP